MRIMIEDISWVEFRDIHNSDLGQFRQGFDSKSLSVEPSIPIYLQFLRIIYVLAYRSRTPIVLSYKGKYCQKWAMNYGTNEQCWLRLKAARCMQPDATKQRRLLIQICISVGLTCTLRLTF